MAGMMFGGCGGDCFKATMMLDGLEDEMMKEGGRTREVQQAPDRPSSKCSVRCSLWRA